MLTLLFLFIWRAVATVHGYVQAYAPTNIAIARLRTRRGLKWAMPVTFVAVPAYLYVAWLMTALVDHGAAEWLYVLTFIAYLNACKFAALALWSPVLWLRMLLSGKDWSARAGRDWGQVDALPAATPKAPGACGSNSNASRWQPLDVRGCHGGV